MLIYTKVIGLSYIEGNIWIIMNLWQPSWWPSWISVHSSGSTIVGEMTNGFLDPKNMVIDTKIVVLADL
jgi:hypothetical protein